MTQVEIKEVNKSFIKKDEDGQMVREIRCPWCRSWLADEYGYAGRLILECLSCKKYFKIKFKHSKGK